MEYEIRHLKAKEWDMAMQLAWDTFLVYEAPEYEPVGVKHFHEFVKGDELKKMFADGHYRAWGAFDERNTIAGVLGIREHWHISLLFVEPSLHHQGIATALLNSAFTEAVREGITEMTVFSSPYAAEFYHKKGFVDMDREKTTDGIRYTPMRIELL
ncbi:MAG: GNAT family N-acetyltransferase [Lachnospiraceae bacterium]|nr:GNAT family N-acetyltransferase [Lachnospiraceae bacterium]